MRTCARDAIDSSGRAVRGLLSCGPLTVLVTLGAALVAWAHDGHSFGSPCHGVSLSEAGQLAEEEHKLVCVYVGRPGRRTPRYLEQPSWSQWPLIDLLVRECVVICLDGKQDDAQLAPYVLAELPVMLVLAPDGREEFRLPGDVSAAALATDLTPRLSDEAALARARQAVSARGDSSPVVHERLAATLARRGECAAALEEYLWCVTEGLRRRQFGTYGAARRRLLFHKLAELAARYPPARQALERERQVIEGILLKERDDANLARDLDELNRSLGERGRTLEFYDRAPEKSRARRVLFDRVLDQLVTGRRYEDVLALVEPLEAFRQEVVMARRSARVWDDAPEARELRGQRSFVVARGAALVEALGGAGRVPEACQLVDAVLRFDRSEPTITLLEQHARRAGRQELVAHVDRAIERSEPRP